MGYAAYLLKEYGISEDRILHRQPGFFKGVSDGMKGAPNALARQKYTKIKHDAEGQSAKALDREADDKIKMHRKNVDKAIDKATKKVFAMAAKKKQSADKSAEKQAAADWLASQGIKAGRASKVGGQKSSGGGGTRNTSDVYSDGDRGSHALFDKVDKACKGQGGLSRENPYKPKGWNAGGPGKGDLKKWGVIHSVEKDGKKENGLARQVFPKEYKDNPKFKGGRFAGDKDGDGKELKAGDQYVAEALNVIVEAIGQGYTDNDAFNAAIQYLREEGGYGPWSAKRALNEVLSVENEE